ncbi:hypothetical protein PoB_001537200 [Plakobranchus ocellatus]|uniref:Uncharacterized protein n=1 Tax=Plakobranchus ocellatus TaxID=259542 RepID=A0AAV3Z2Y2_9GAST|nr:hypothetical protein PoB_001537200 [Plakobranchus ocellatus]
MYLSSNEPLTCPPISGAIQPSIASQRTIWQLPSSANNLLNAVLVLQQRILCYDVTPSIVHLLTGLIVVVFFFLITSQSLPSFLLPSIVAKAATWIILKIAMKVLLEITSMCLSWKQPGASLLAAAATFSPYNIM